MVRPYGSRVGHGAACTALLVLAAACAVDPAPAPVASPGVAVIVGHVNDRSGRLVRYGDSAHVALLNVSDGVRSGRERPVPRESQIAAEAVEAASNAPPSYRLRLPTTPPGASIDFSHSGRSGVKVYVLAAAPNLQGLGDTLGPLEQRLLTSSSLADPQSTAPRLGSVLIWSPDAQQQVPGGPGKDGRLFSADDPLVPVQAGYSIANFGADGALRLDRSREARIDTLEPPAAPLDFSAQSIADSYEALVAVLARSAAAADGRVPDWRELRLRFFSRVKQADASGDQAAYAAVLRELAAALRGAQATTPASTPTPAAAPSRDGRPNGFGASMVELSDGRIIVKSVGDSGPAKQAGWEFGTQIVSVNGKPIAAWLAARPADAMAGITESSRRRLLDNALAFAPGSVARIGFRTPGSNRLLVANLKAGDFAPERPRPAAAAPALITAKPAEGEIGILRWRDTSRPRPSLAGWRGFIARFHGAPGIVIDLRGGVDADRTTFMAMASFLFADARTWPLDDAEAGSNFVGGLRADAKIDAPAPASIYTGPLLVLVDEDTAGNAAAFAKLMQESGRGRIVGQSTPALPSAVIKKISLPGGLVFGYTENRARGEGAAASNAAGIALDSRIAVTEEAEWHKRRGEDPVLDATLVLLSHPDKLRSPTK